MQGGAHTKYTNPCTRNGHFSRKGCMHVTTALGQHHTVINEFEWSVPEYQDKLVVHLGGLHISMCFLRTIGDHMKETGLVDSWVESGLLGPNATDNVERQGIQKSNACA